MSLKLGCCLLLSITNLSFAAGEDTIHSIFVDHFKKYQQQEYFSGAALAYKIPGQEIQKYYAGTISHDPKSAAVSEHTLFQIGSITKSFTSVMMLKAEQDQKLHLHDSFVKWLPEYSNWPAEISIEQLLNMTANLPNYTDAPLWYAQETEDLGKYWKPQELLTFVYPKEANVPLRTGYFYSNTGYLLADLIYQKATKTSFDLSLQKMLKDIGLNDTHYPLPTIDKDIAARVAHGYNYNPYDNPALVAKDLVSNNLSWAAAAGGMLSTPVDVIKWVEYLFVDPKTLSEEQRRRLMMINSVASGKALSKVNNEDHEGFGLGVAHMYKESIGDFWFYEGITLSFRAIYLYKPCNGLIIAANFNSTPDGKNDSLGKLIEDVYLQLLKENPQLQCVAH